MQQHNEITAELSQADQGAKSGLLDLPTHSLGFDCTLEERCVYSRIESQCFSFALLCLYWSILRGPYIFWRLDGWAVFPSGSRLAAFGLLLLALSLFRSIYSRLRPSLPRQPWPSLRLEVGFLGLLAYFLSDWPCQTYSLFKAPSIRGEWFLASALFFVLMRQQCRKLLLGLLPLAVSILLVNFFQESAGRLLFTDDHTPVFYRLSQLSENFPFIPFYNPAWNAGSDARDFFSTGILNLFLLSYPILKIFPPEQSYNFLVASVLFILLPANVYFASQLLRYGRLTGVFSSLIALASSLLWYRWGLKYGAMGFVTSVSLLPLNLALAIRIVLGREALNRQLAVLAVVSFSLMFFWSLTAVVFLPFVGLSLFSPRVILKQKYVRGILLALSLIALLWVPLWLKSAKVLGFLHADKPSASSQFRDDTSKVGNREGQDLSKPETSALSLSSGRSQSLSKDPKRARQVKRSEHHFSLSGIQKALRNFAVSANPLVIFLALPAILFLPFWKEKIMWLSFSSWLIFLGAVVAPLKPQLELDRMFVVLAIALSLPCGLFLSQLWSSLTELRGKTFKKCLFSLAGGACVLGPLTVCSVLQNRSPEQYYFAEPVVQEMSQVIKEKGGEGRTLFTGFVLHELSNGHLAPLAYYSGKELLASSPVHNRWWYTEMIPEEYREKEGGVEEYLDLMNVSTVFAHEKFWRQYFSSRPELYRQIWEGGRFKLYERLGFNYNIFQEGSGRIDYIGSNEIRLSVYSAKAVIKYNYLPFLEVVANTSLCKLSAETISSELQFIRLDNCETSGVITVRGKTAWRRLFANS